jgi:superfamily II DNA or RNA helicase
MNLLEFLKQENNRTLGAYREKPGLLREHYGIEEQMLSGGYGYRQILELVQNGADAILEAAEARGNASGVSEVPKKGKIQIWLTDQYLYAANTGAELSKDGLEALLSSHSSPKRGNQIGRFGLGFKSLLGLGTRIDLFTARNGIIRFEPERCKAKLRERFPVERLPGLRLAWPMEANLAHRDIVVAGLLKWAETVVRVELRDASAVAAMRDELAKFPAEFLLFFPVPTELVLEVTGESTRRLHVEFKGKDRILHDGSSESTWRVFERDIAIAPDDELRRGMDVHVRDSVPLAWAVPVSGQREAAGRFWAFFPTDTASLVPGILNAPWGLNNDRNNVIRNDYNSFLMEESAKLIADSIVDLATPEDPGKVVDYFPRRLDRQDLIPAPLVKRLQECLLNTACVPNMNGSFRLLKDLHFHPVDNPELVLEWAGIARQEVRSIFMHHTCLLRQRADRLKSLSEILEADNTIDDSHRPTLAKWMRLLIYKTLDSVQAAILIAAKIKDIIRPDLWQENRYKFEIFLDSSATLRTADKLVIAAEAVQIPGRYPIHPKLLEDKTITGILRETFGIREPDDSVWLETLREKFPDPHQRQEEVWAAFWKALRGAPERVIDQLVESPRWTGWGYQVFKFRRRDGKWVEAGNALLPGGYVDEIDDDENRKVLIDSDFHADDVKLLQKLGVRSETIETHTMTETSIFENWLAHWRAELRSRYDSRPQPSKLDVLDGFRVPVYFELLRELSGAANARLTRQIVKFLVENHAEQTVRFGHKTQTHLYEVLDIETPLFWWIAEHGNVMVGEQVIAVAFGLKYGNNWPFPSPSEWDELKDTVELIEDIRFEPRCSGWFIWKEILKKRIPPEWLACDDLAKFWDAMAAEGVIPPELCFGENSVPLKECYVSTNAELSRRVRAMGLPVVKVGQIALERWLRDGAKDLSEWIKIIHDPLNVAPAPLVDVYPELAAVLKDEFRAKASCQLVKNLCVKIDSVSEILNCSLSEDEVLLLNENTLHDLTWTERVRIVLAEAHKANWLAYSEDECLRRVLQAETRERVERVRQLPSLPEKIVALVGEQTGPLLDALHGIAHLDFVETMGPLELAQLVLSHHGPASLAILTSAMRDQGFDVPGRWGTLAGRQFVESLGFPESFAISQGGKREAEETAIGPYQLPPLHDFQEEVYDRVRQIASSNASQRRAVVCLPTGGGKTRVTVETAVKLILAPDGPQRTVLWVAQTDELCEQAVQAFLEVWTNFGATRTPLRVIRLWGGNPNPTPPNSEAPVVVVASIQTLVYRMEGAGLEWLNQPGMLVIDECHHAITRSYTQLLRWLKPAKEAGKSETIREPLILGLSATPFRVDDDESVWLANRFGNRWLPANQATLYQTLTQRGVLARPVFEPLTTEFALTEDEQKRIDALLNRAGNDFEIHKIFEEFNQRLAANEERNRKLVNCLKGSAEASILFFANSVTHAEEMSARFNHAGLPSAFVSGETPKAVRRYFLEQFQAGELRILCNHSVLTTGFDAPKVDLVVVARQVFSPVRYMQMIGRGLRGPLNGGTASCRILSVIDNLGKFQDRHPFYYAERFYQSQ